MASEWKVFWMVYTGVNAILTVLSLIYTEEGETWFKSLDDEPVRVKIVSMIGIIIVGSFVFGPNYIRRKLAKK